MAKVVVTLRIMPESPEVSLPFLKEKAIPLISTFGGEVGKEEIEPVGFGLKALKLYFILDESRGGTDSLEADITKVQGVRSVEVVDVRRTLG